MQAARCIREGPNETLRLKAAQRQRDEKRSGQSREEEVRGLCFACFLDERFPTSDGDEDEAAKCPMKIAVTPAVALIEVKENVESEGKETTKRGIANDRAFTPEA